MIPRYWEESPFLGIYVNTSTKEVLATIKRGEKIGAAHVWEWVERKRSFLTREAAIIAVERAI